LRKETEDVFCPQCAQNQPDDLNYCKACGANLSAVRSALVAGNAGEKFDWNKTWLAEMMMSSEEKTRRAAKLARVPDADMVRRREIKAGIITASTGLSLSIVLSILMEAIVINGNLSALAADILSRVWIVGVIPVLVGLALIFNGVFISPKSRKVKIEEASAEDALPPAVNGPGLMRGAPFSVTDETTRHLDTVSRGKPTSDISDKS
jgi:hypothetical protein